MDALHELYQELLLDHGKHPRNFGDMPDATHTAEGFNPLCGDRVVVNLRTSDDSIEKATFTGKACAVCTASASMMTQVVEGQPVQHALELFEHLRQYLTSEGGGRMNDEDLALQALAGVRRFPMRVKCATLPWHTLVAALRSEGEPVTTE